MAIAVNLTSGGLDKLAVYKGLGVPEVLIWQNTQLMLYDLRGEVLCESDRSQFFPNLNLTLFAQHIRPQDQPQAIKEFLQAIRQ